MTNQPCSFTDILDILACPKCRGSLVLIQNERSSGLDCRVCDKIYPVHDDIPLLLIDKAVSREAW